MSNYIIDPLAIATQGFLVENNIAEVNTLAILTQGYIVLLEEEIIEVPVIQGGHGVSIPHNPYAPVEYKKKKKITAIVTIAGTTYRESIELDDLQITVKDINVEVSNPQKPTIKLTVIKR